MLLAALFLGRSPIGFLPSLSMRAVEAKKKHCSARRGNAVLRAGRQAPEVHQAPISVTTGAACLQLPGRIKHAAQKKCTEKRPQLPLLGYVYCRGFFADARTFLIVLL
jgi:hypothetical protein